MGGNTKLKNGFVVVVIILFALLILEPGINANQVKTELKQLVVPCSYEDEIDRWAVIIGISDYKGSSADLPCPAKEAQELYDMLISKDSRWDMNNVQLLLNGAAAKNDILSALDWLIENAGEGDVVLFAYNGHGSFVKDDKWDELDRRDETIVTWELDDITDDTLSDKFNEISAKNIEGMFLIFDCCFSGGIIDWKMSMVEKSQLNENKKRVIKELSKSTMFTNELIADIKTKNRVVLASTIPRGIGLELRGPDGWFSFTRGIITALEKKRTMAEGICRYAKWWWLTNPTVIKVLFNPLLWYESFLYFIEEGIIIMPLPIWKDRYPRLSPMSKKLPIIGFCNVKSPIISDPSPEDDAKNVLLDLPQMTFHIHDPQGDLMDYTVETSPDIGSGSGTGVSEGTYSISVSGLDYAQDYTWFVNVTDGENWKHKEFSFTTRPVPGPWWNINWSYRKEMIVNYSMVEDELDNFPVLIAVDSDSDLANHAQDDGDDIVFTNYAREKLNHEIEKYNGSTGELIAWVNVSNLKPDNILYMYYGNLNSSNQQNVEETWNDNYLAVYHMNDIDDGIQDSTSNSRDGIEIEDPSYRKDGILGKSAIEFDGTNDGFDIPNDFGLYQHDFTIECWAKFDKYLHGKDDKQQLIYLHGEVHGHLQWRPVSNSVVWSARYTDEYYWDHINLVYNPTDTTNFHYYTATIDHNNIDKGFYDGNQIGSQNNNGLQQYSDENLIGFRVWDPDDHFFDGMMDEVRISNVVRSSEWIATTYNSINDYTSFLSFGPEETGP